LPPSKHRLNKRFLIAIVEANWMKSKKVIIVINLVEESVEKANEEIEKEIFQELSTDLPVIPWLERVEKVTVIEE
jgi:ribosome-binding ATPase YchF (GTP1/OBG family)